MLTWENNIHTDLKECEIKLKTLLELITIDMREAFAKAGYDEEVAKETLSNRPDLCEYQCNGAMAGAKK